MRLRRAARHAESIGIHPRETCAAQGDLGLHKPLMVCLCEVLQLGIGFENIWKHVDSIFEHVWNMLIYVTIL